MTVDWLRNFLEHADFWPSPIICFTARIATVATRSEMMKVQHSEEPQVVVARLRAQQGPCEPSRDFISSRFPCCVLLALSWNTNENPSTDKLSRAINYFISKFEEQ